MISRLTEPVDLRSDAVTKPSAGMRKAIAAAEVGDDFLDGDPTTRRLEAHVADLLGKEKALFFPTGTMANQTAIWLHAQRGTEILVDPDSHIVRREVAACAALCGVQPRMVPALRADRPPTEVAEGLERELTMPSASRIALLCLENTHNGAGGAILQREAQETALRSAQRHGIPTHIDGARIWNASCATGRTVAELAHGADTVMVCFDKGLGAPVGSALAGVAGLIDAARPVRRRFGGAMRQTGMLAAAAHYALDHHVTDLATDHDHARTLARALEGIPGVRVVPPQTNIVMLDLMPPWTAADIAARAQVEGVLVAIWTPSRLRLVTHRDVDAQGIAATTSVLARIFGDDRPIRGRA